MRRTLRNSRLLTLFLVGTMAFAVARSLGAQQQQPLPDGYIRPAPITATGLAPNMKGEHLYIARMFKVYVRSG